MNSELITHWSDHDSAVLKALSLATSNLRIFDEDLIRLKLEEPEKLKELQRLLEAGSLIRIEIALRNAEPFRRNNPRLMKLLATYPHKLSVIECPPHLATLSDALLIADDRHALIRFHKDNARSRLIIDDTESCQPYRQRFSEILHEGGLAISSTTLGL